MASVVASGPSTAESRRGKKRAGDNSIESEQRLSKRFDLLNLENGTRLYLPVHGSSSATPAVTPAPIHTQYATPIQPSEIDYQYMPDSAISPKALLEPNKKRERPRHPPPDDAMQVEDTLHRVYIADLDAELSDLESDEDTPIFLPDIEMHLAKLPAHLLRGPELRATKDNALVLYQVPSSLTVPKEQDTVRKAIEEARSRLREKQMNAREPEWGGGSMAVTPEATVARDTPPPSFDGDEMEID